MERGADVELEQVGLMEQAAPTAVDNWGKVRSLATDPNVDQRGAEGADAGSTLSLAEMRMQQAFDLVPRTVGGEPSSVTLEELEVTLKALGFDLGSEQQGSAILAAELVTGMRADGSKEVGRVHFVDNIEGVLRKLSAAMAGRGASKSVQDIVSIHEAFMQADVDDSGEVDEMEFNAILKALKINMTTKQRKELWAVFDQNDDGGVDWWEFRVGLSESRARKLANFNITALLAIDKVYLDDAVTDKQHLAALSTLTFMERRAIKSLRNFAKKHDMEQVKNKASKGTLHVLEEKDKRFIASAQRWCVLRSFMAGALAAFIGGVSNTVFSELFQTNGSLCYNDCPDCANEVECDPNSYGRTYFVVCIMCSTVVASFVEMIIMYFDALKTVLKIAQTVGLRLYPLNEERAFVAASLARAALEIGNPKTMPFGIDPDCEKKRWKMVVIAFVYKAKVGFTTFLLKLLMKRIGSRVAAKSFLNFVAMPVQGSFNAIVSWHALRDAYVRVMGKCTAVEVAEEIFKSHVNDFTEGDVQLFNATLARSLGILVIKKQDVHPNIQLLLEHIVDQTVGRDCVPLNGERSSEVAAGGSKISLMDEHAFFSGLRKLTTGQQDCVLRLLSLASVLDGALGKQEARLLRRVFLEVPRAYRDDDDEAIAALRAIAAGFGDYSSLHLADIIAALSDQYDTDAGGCRASATKCLSCFAC